MIRRLNLRQRLAPFTRCLRCNGMLATVSKDEVLGRLEPLTRRYYDQFRRCRDCGRIYWARSHHARMAALVEQLLDQLSGDAR
ncbi:hypothetical protein LAUMK41_00868 [Mycobacterium attenuatum]|nr:hypothetical protein LAUMK41_00868 [Mycobacterium attenuatum]